MLPAEVLSTTAVYAPFTFPRNIPRRALLDYEYGGVAIEDGTQGIKVKVWRGEYIDDQVVLSAPGVPATAVLTVPDMFDFGFSFDRNMRVFICYELRNGTSFFYWFDTVANDYVTTQLPAGSRFLRCAHDDTRDLEVNTSDIILAYIRGGALMWRAQRERYLEEHVADALVGPVSLVQVGMNKVLRFQFQVLPAAIPGVLI